MELSEDTVNLASIMFGVCLTYLAIKMFYPQLFLKSGEILVRGIDCSSCQGKPDRIDQFGSCVACGRKCVDDSKLLKFN